MSEAVKAAKGWMANANDMASGMASDVADATKKVGSSLSSKKKYPGLFEQLCGISFCVKQIPLALAHFVPENDSTNDSMHANVAARIVRSKKKKSSGWC